VTFVKCFSLLLHPVVLLIFHYRFGVQKILFGGRQEL
jgi:hypothetical protein